MKSIPEQLAATLRPAQETLFSLLRGIDEKQAKTNELLTQLVEFQAPKPDLYDVED